MISKAYTIDTANTWEKKTITFGGDETNAIANDNGSGIDLNFWLVAGSNFTSGTLQPSWGSFITGNRAPGQVNLADSTSNEWYLTGCQLEVGSTASGFEFEPYASTLQKCQRYYYLTQSGGGTQEYHFAILDGGTAAYPTAYVKFPIEMRAVPTGELASYGAFFYNSGSEASVTPSGGSDNTAGLTHDYGRVQRANISNNPGSSHAQKAGQWLIAATFDAEL